AESCYCWGACSSPPLPPVLARSSVWSPDFSSRPVRASAVHSRAPRAASGIASDRYSDPPTGPSPYRAFHPRLQQLPYAQQTTRDNRWLPPRVYHSQLGHMVQVFRHGAAQRDLAGVAGEHAADMRRGSMADNLISSNPEPTQVVGGGPAVTAQDLTKALKEVERSKRRRAIGRRALIVGAGAAACVGAFELAPQ